MKDVISFCITVNGHKDHSESIEEYTKNKRFVNKSAIIEDFVKNDKIVVINVQVANHSANSQPHTNINIGCCDVMTAMHTLDVLYPQVYKQLPELNFEGFEKIASKQKCASHLRYTRVHTDDEKDDLLWLNIDDDDIIGHVRDIDIFTADSIGRGYYCEIQCYPHNPSSFWAYYGSDFKSLINHVVKDYK